MYVGLSWGCRSSLRDLSPNLLQLRAQKRHLALNCAELCHYISRSIPQFRQLSGRGRDKGLCIGVLYRPLLIG